LIATSASIPKQADQMIRGSPVRCRMAWARPSGSCAFAPIIWWKSPKAAGANQGRWTGASAGNRKKDNFTDFDVAVATLT